MILDRVHLEEWSSSILGEQMFGAAACSRPREFVEVVPVPGLDASQVPSSGGFLVTTNLKGTPEWTEGMMAESHI